MSRQGRVCGEYVTDRGELFDGFRSAEQAGVADVFSACEQVVHFETDSVKELVPSRVDRYDEGLSACDGRGVFEHSLSFGECGSHERDVTLSQIAHTPVD